MLILKIIVNDMWVLEWFFEIKLRGKRKKKFFLLFEYMYLEKSCCIIYKKIFFVGNVDFFDG